MATTTTTEAEQTARAAAADARERIHEQGERAIGAAREKAERYATARRDFAADYLADVSDALGSAEATLNERGRSGTARILQRAAEEVGELSERVHGQDVNRLVREVESFARNRPGLFFGGAFLLGFAMTRLISATGPSYEPDDDIDVESGVGADPYYGADATNM